MMESENIPGIVSKESQLAFENQAKEMGLDPSHIWIGGYVYCEFAHLKPILEAYQIPIQGLKILEFGCNVGASSIVYSYLGAKVYAIDVWKEMVDLARLNAQRFGIENIIFSHVQDTRKLPFEDQFFDLISCNSVLEYIDHSHLSSIQHEIDRVLKPGGKIFISGTSSRLWPKEVHSGRWLINYIPRLLDRICKKNWQRGVFPWTIRYGFGKHYENFDVKDRGISFLRSRAMIRPPNQGIAIRMMVQIARIFRIGPGFLAPNLSCLLEKKLQ